MAEELGFGWNEQTGEYVSLRTWRRIAGETALDTLDARIDVGFERLQDMLAAVLDGGAPLEAWQEAFVVELRRAHTQIAALGRGGWAQMTREDWLAVGRQLRFEYRCLRNFAEEIAAGRLSRAQIELRMQMYADHVWTSYWGAQTTAKKTADFEEERRVPDPGAESCGDCIGYAGEGWQPIGTLPEPGQACACGARCKCRKEYRKEGDDG